MAESMTAHESSDRLSAGYRVEGLLTWLGGGHWRELGERHERSTHAVAGAIVALGGLLAWLVASLAVSASAHMPVSAIVAMTLVFGLLVGAVTRGTASGPEKGGIAGRAAVAIVVGVVVGELAATVLFSASIDRELDRRALRDADSAPAVVQASVALQRTRDARGNLDGAVDLARRHQDTALVIARCEYNPSPACPQTRITGVPGPGPETRSSNELLADAQHELDNALAARDRQAPELDARVVQQEEAVAAARNAVVADSGRGLGARWVAMNGLTLADIGSLVLRLLTVTVFALLYLLPLILRRWRGETTHDRRAAARADRERAEISRERAELDRERAEVDADTAIAIKRAEVRREAEILWAEHQLTQARLAIAAQEEIDREQQRRRVVEALDAPVVAQRAFEPVNDDVYLPIAAEAEAASRVVPELPAASTENLPAHVEPAGDVEPNTEPAATSAPTGTFPAARWIRPLVPPFVARVIDDATHPLRTAHQVFEDVEEIAFSFKRVRRVTVDSGPGERQEAAPPAPAVEEPPTRIASSRARKGAPAKSAAGLEADTRHPALDRKPRAEKAGLSAGSKGGRREIAGRKGPRELDPPDGPRQLPPAD
jgi:hypothetical protein